MAWRWGPGPVFAVELRGVARRWQTYSSRAGFVAALLAALAFVWWFNVGTRATVNLNDLARIGTYFYYGLVGTQLAVLLLAGPAATAGAVCQDKARGGLLHLLVTDLSDAEIVLGKLAARLAPVFGLLLAGLPVLALATLLGGIDPDAVFGAFLISAGAAVFGSALALAFSVWAGKTQEALLAAYGVEAVALLALPLWSIATSVGVPGVVPAWLEKSNPFWLAFAVYGGRRATDPADPLWFFAGSLALAALLTLLAVATVRRVAVRQSGAPARRRRSSRLAALWRRLPGPSLDGNPVLWREWHRRQPSRWMRAIWGLFALAAGGVTGLTVYLILSGSRLNDLAGVVNGLTVTLGLLLFSVTAVTSLSEERVRGSLDVLLTTPLSSWSIVWGKWWGAFRAVPLLAALPAVILALSLTYPPDRGGYPRASLFASVSLAALVVALILAYGAWLTSLGLALATWVPRVGRAAAACAAAYALMLFLPAIVAQSFRNGTGWGEWIIVACPFWGTGALTEMVRSGVQPQVERFLGPAAFWVGAYSALAAALLGATLLTFDRCLGRVRQRRGPQRAMR